MVLAVQGNQRKICVNYIARHSTKGLGRITEGIMTKGEGSYVISHITHDAWLCNCLQFEAGARMILDAILLTIDDIFLDAKEKLSVAIFPEMRIASLENSDLAGGVVACISK